MSFLRPTTVRGLFNQSFGLTWAALPAVSLLLGPKAGWASMLLVGPVLWTAAAWRAFSMHRATSRLKWRDAFWNVNATVLGTWPVAVAAVLLLGQATNTQPRWSGGTPATVVDVAASAVMVALVTSLRLAVLHAAWTTVLWARHRIRAARA